MSNTGPVVPESEVDRLFQPFQQLGADRTRHDGGHGFGLSIVHTIAAAHDGTVEPTPLTAGGLLITVTFPPPGLRR
ncbi:MAG: hypothetical protein QOI21_2772 [Actinomycetota bacterium]|nr:hypothetical protein [Actinomycetota bacterium]